MLLTVMISTELNKITREKNVILIGRLHLNIKTKQNMKTKKHSLINLLLPKLPSINILKSI